MNQAYCRISGYTKEEIIEGNHRIVAAGIQSPDFLANMWRTISSGTPWRGKSATRIKQVPCIGSTPSSHRLRTRRTNRKIYLNSYGYHCQQEGSASRLASQRSAFNIIEGTNVGTWEWNVQTGEMRINERWAEQAGYETNELAPITVQTWDTLTHPEDLVKAKSLMRKHFEHELPYYEYETRLKHKDGHWIWVLTRGALSVND